MGAGDLNPGPQACRAGTLPAKPSPHIVFILFLFKMDLRPILKSAYVCLHVGMCTGKGAQGGQKRVSDLLELELQTAMDHLTWVLETKLRSSARTSALNVELPLEPSPSVSYFPVVSKTRKETQADKVGSSLCPQTAHTHWAQMVSLGPPGHHTHYSLSPFTSFRTGSEVTSGKPLIQVHSFCPNRTQAQSSLAFLLPFCHYPWY